MAVFYEGVLALFFYTQHKLTKRNILRTTASRKNTLLSGFLFSKDGQSYTIPRFVK